MNTKCLIFLNFKKPLGTIAIDNAGNFFLKKRLGNMRKVLKLAIGLERVFIIYFI